MREIKFRFWSKILKHFVIPNNDIFVGALKDKNMIVMQFTGLKDKNGKEIFEGDKMTLKDKENLNIGEVYFDEEWYAFKLKTHVSTYWLHEAEEVIGNQFENQELLER
ncbi:MAG: YopX family protein [Nanoarchaeota archaeon]